MLAARFRSPRHRPSIGGVQSRSRISLCRVASGAERPGVVPISMQGQNERELREQLARLISDHRQLDAEIAALEAAGHADQLQIRRMKRRKLMLKEQEELMCKVVDLEEELDKVKNERQELVLQVQELQDDNDELNAMVKKASGVANKRMSVYGGGVRNEGSFDARRQVARRPRGGVRGPRWRASTCIRRRCRRSTGGWRRRRAGSTQRSAAPRLRPRSAA